MTATCVATPLASSELGDPGHVLDTVLDAPAAEDPAAAVVALWRARVAVVARLEVDWPKKDARGTGSMYFTPYKP